MLFTFSMTSAKREHSPDPADNTSESKCVKIPISDIPESIIGSARNVELEHLYLVAQNIKSTARQQVGFDHKKKNEWVKLDNGINEARLPKKKVALLMSYCGTGYHGMQINPTFPSIELDLFKALACAGAVSQSNAMDSAKISFMRCARTDRGVHAAGQVVSLKMVISDDVVEKINKYLPPQIRVWGYSRTHNNFQAKTYCDSRVYEYLFPTYLLLACDPKLYPYSKVAQENGVTISNCGRELHGTIEPVENSESLMKEKRANRISEADLARFREILNRFVGTNNHHNFTVKKKFSDPTCKRYIISLTASDPFMKGESEWISCKIHGQAFMLHQIRKMIALAILMTRTNTPADLLRLAFSDVRLNLPKAPALGLLLERPVFAHYNEKQGVEASRDTIDFGKFQVKYPLMQGQIDEFKEKWIYNSLIAQETEENSFDEWIRLIDASPDTHGTRLIIKVGILMLMALWHWIADLKGCLKLLIQPLIRMMMLKIWSSK